jgi:hypothetical protein
MLEELNCYNGCELYIDCSCVGYYKGGEFIPLRHLSIAHVSVCSTYMEYKQTDDPTQCVEYMSLCG